MREDDVQMFGPIKPAVVNLVYGATVATDCSLGNHFRLTATGNFTLSNVSNPTDGQRLLWEILQDGTGNRLISLDTNFTVPSNLPAIILSTSPNVSDMLSGIYNSALGKVVITGFGKEYF